MMELNEKQFISGFNSGYLLAQYEPEMLTSLLTQIIPVNSYIYGMSFGQKEYELEQVKSQIIELKGIRRNGRYEKDLGKD